MIAGTSSAAAMAGVLAQLAGHPKLLLVVVTTNYYAARLEYRLDRPALTVRLTTVPEREHLGRVLYRLGR